MMEANELRIGNFISDIHASDSFYSKIKKLDLTRCHYGAFHSSYNDLKPIPITEEWLLRFGFESYKDEYVGNIVWGKKDCDVLGFVVKKDIIIGVLIYGYLKYFEKPIFVHWVQNIYYDLKGKELELK